MPNRLISENSPYLLQHVNNPVDWYPWSQEALDRAVEEDKPIFLSVGYSACHWCHVMAHESFEDADTAAIMNEHFINIKVDREERPDIDAIYMNAVVALTGQGGWPMSVFLTPDTKPFYGGTYFPPTHRHNMPSFREILLTIERLWREDRARLLESSNQITNELQKRMVVKLDRQVLNTNTVEQAAMRLAQTYDWENGGWGKAPKFPQPMAIRFLLRRALKGDKLALEISNHALDAMARGGMYDVVGGGFARYSTDDEWLVPHFEKMLYDNALLARCYLISYLITGNEFHRQVCERTLDFLMREMSNASDPNSDSIGGLYSSIDADSEGEEGKFYLWDYHEIKEIIANILPETTSFQKSDMEHIFMTAYALTEHGNFEGKIILQQVVNDDKLAERFNSSLEEVSAMREGILTQLLNSRDQRIRPTTDDKVIVAWNALAIIAFSEAARYLKRDDYLSFARQAGEFLLRQLHPADRLLRSYRQGSSGYNAFLEDIASLIQALVSLYQSDPDLHWINSAIDLTEEMVGNYKDPEGGFYDTRDDQDELILRPKEIQDNATPSGNALAAMALLQIAGYTGNGEFRHIAEQMLESIQNFTIRYPSAFSEWLCTLDLALTGLKEIVILGDPEDPHYGSLHDQLWSTYRPNIITAMSGTQVKGDAPPLLQDRELLNNAPTAFVCENFVCKYPINSTADFALALDDE